MAEENQNKEVFNLTPEMQAELTKALPGMVSGSLLTFIKQAEKDKKHIVELETSLKYEKDKSDRYWSEKEELKEKIESFELCEDNVKIAEAEIVLAQSKLDIREEKLRIENSNIENTLLRQKLEVQEARIRDTKEIVMTIAGNAKTFELMTHNNIINEKSTTIDQYGNIKYDEHGLSTEVDKTKTINETHTKETVVSKENNLE